MSHVTDFPAAPGKVAIEHFLRRLSVETDCADVAGALRPESKISCSCMSSDRRKPMSVAMCPARSICRIGKFRQRRMAEWPDDTLFVVYCAGPHCNGADQAALKLARLGRPVKIMIGGVTGWADEGLSLRWARSHMSAELHHRTA